MRCYVAAPPPQRRLVPRGAHSAIARDGASARLAGATHGASCAPTSRAPTHAQRAGQDAHISGKSSVNVLTRGSYEFKLTSWYETTLVWHRRRCHKLVSFLESKSSSKICAVPDGHLRVHASAIERTAVQTQKQESWVSIMARLQDLQWGGPSGSSSCVLILPSF